MSKGALIRGVAFAKIEPIDFFTQEIDPTTEPIVFETAESVGYEPLISEGEEEIKRNATAILAIAKDDDLQYGADVTLIDNVFDIRIASLISGGIVKTTAGEITGFRTSLIREGATMRPFRLTIWAPNYEGTAISGYFKITFPFCTGRMPSITIAKEFLVPEFTFRASEASKLGLAALEMDMVDTLPDEAAPRVIVTTLGVLNEAKKEISDIPAATTVAAFKAGISVSIGSDAIIETAAGEPVLQGNVLATHKLVVRDRRDSSKNTSYTLKLKV